MRNICAVSTEEYIGTLTEYEPEYIRNIIQTYNSSTYGRGVLSNQASNCSRRQSTR